MARRCRHVLRLRLRLGHLGRLGGGCMAMRMAERRRERRLPGELVICLRVEALNERRGCECSATSSTHMKSHVGWFGAECKPVVGVLPSSPAWKHRRLVPLSPPLPLHQAVGPYVNHGCYIVFSFVVAASATVS